MTTDWRPTIAVPARDEEQRLPALIDALGRQTWLDRQGRRLDAVIVLNNCSDGSRAAVAAAARWHPRLEVVLIEADFPEAEAHVGSARRLAMDQAYARAAVPARTAILTTDADAVPTPDWVEANLRAFDAGADLVGGLIVGDAGEEARLGPGFRRRADLHARYATLADRLAALIDPIEHDPWPRHHDHTGASLAVRADVYQAVGGMPALPRREDLAFVSRMRAAGYRLRHAPEVRVVVSARLVGRAAGGMADCIAGWVQAETAGLPLLVEAPEAIATRAERRAHLRRQVAGLGVAPNATALIEMTLPEDPDAAGAMPVETAIARIERMIAEREAPLLAA